MKPAVLWRLPHFRRSRTKPRETVEMAKSPKAMPTKPWRKRAKNWLIYHLIRTLIGMVRVMPRRLALWCFAALGELAYWLLREVRGKMLRHLELAFARQQSPQELRRLARASLRTLGRNAAEALRLPRLVREGLDRRVHFVGREHLDRAFARGRGVLCITAHLGCWELMAAFIARHYPLAVVGATLYDPRLDAILVQERTRAGYQTIPRTAAGTRQILRWLRNGGLLGILIDQDTRVDGEFVDFFGRPAYTPAGPVLLAERTGAAVVPMAIRLNPDFSHTVEVRAELQLHHTGAAAEDRRVNVLLCSKAVEAFIRETPEQWVWMHERWKTPEPVPAAAGQVSVQEIS